MNKHLALLTAALLCAPVFATPATHNITEKAAEKTVADTSKHAAPHEAKAQVSPDQALAQLEEGNKRFVKANAKHGHQNAKRRAEVAASQNPFAVIVSCSDSRVPPEVLFDQGIGDLFVIRSAGEVLDSVGMGSVEYAVEHLGTPLVMVLGHERCGAVKATIEGGEAPGSIGSICNLIKPSVDKAKTQEGDLATNATHLHAGSVADKISASPILAKLTAAGKVKVVKAYYDLDDGTVTLLK